MVWFSCKVYMCLLGLHLFKIPKLLLQGCRHWGAKVAYAPEKIEKPKKTRKYGTGRIAWSQNSDVLHTDFVTPYFLLIFSWSSDQGLLSLIILQQATRKAYPRVYQCIWGNYIIFAKKNHNSTILSTWVVYTYMHVWKCDCV